MGRIYPNSPGDSRNVFEDFVNFNWKALKEGKFDKVDPDPDSSILIRIVGLIGLIPTVIALPLAGISSLLQHYIIVIPTNVTESNNPLRQIIKDLLKVDPKDRLTTDGFIARLNNLPKNEMLSISNSNLLVESLDGLSILEPLDEGYTSSTSPTEKDLSIQTVHRDFKEGNTDMLIEKYGKLEPEEKLKLFTNLASELSNKEASFKNQISFTILSSPEQLSEGKFDDLEKSAMWSVGVILYLVEFGNVPDYLKLEGEGDEIEIKIETAMRDIENDPKLKNIPPNQTSVQTVIDYFKENDIDLLIFEKYKTLSPDEKDILFDTLQKLENSDSTFKTDIKHMSFLRPPEEILKPLTKKVDEKATVWAAGALLYIATFGNWPEYITRDSLGVEGKNVLFQEIQKINDDKNLAVNNDNLDDSIEALIKDSLKLEPIERPMTSEFTGRLKALKEPKEITGYTVKKVEAQASARFEDHPLGLINPQKTKNSVYPYK